jgi:hypothetical protein
VLVVPEGEDAGNTTGFSRVFTIKPNLVQVGQRARAGQPGRRWNQLCMVVAMAAVRCAIRVPYAVRYVTRWPCVWQGHGAQSTLSRLPPHPPCHRARTTL